MKRLAAMVAFLAAPVCADVVVPSHTIPARSLITADDLTMLARDIPGAVTTLDLVVGLEARVTLYAGRPIRAADLGLPAIVERNQTLPLIYQHGGLYITTEGRALDRAAPGDWVRVMNMSSRTTVMAMIGADGAAYVSN